MTKESFSILASFCGPSRALTLPSFLRLLEEISIKDVIKAGIPKEKTLNKGLLWVISRLVIKVNRVPSYDEKVTLETFAFKKVHYLFPRGYIMRDEKGGLLLECEAIWGLIDEKSRKVIDPNDYKISIRSAKTPLDFSLSDFDFSLSSFEKVQRIEDRKIRLSEIDLNSHMSNFHYGEWWMDEFKEDVFPRADTIKIAFFLELHEGEEVEIKASSNNATLIGYKKETGDKAFQVETKLKS